MKWKNIDIGVGCYYITGTLTEWLPLLARDEIRQAVCYEMNVALRRYRATLMAYVIMPDHLHLLVFLPEPGMLDGFCKSWRGRSGRRIVDVLKIKGDAKSLGVMARHANGNSVYAPWKEQVRALAIDSEWMFRQKVDYIHRNPVSKKLVENPGDWLFSSFGCHERGGDVILPAR